MAEAGFPSQHTTATTVTSSTAVQTNLRFDPSYLRTIPGLLKCIQITLNLIGFISIQCSGGWAYHSRAGWFDTVAMTGFWFTGVLLAFYLFHVIEKYYKLPWLKIEFIFCVVMVFCYLIAASLAVALGVEAFKVAGAFGFFALGAYAVDGYLKFKAIQSGEIAQGDRVITKQTTVTSPAY